MMSTLNISLAVYDSNDYSAPQALGAHLWAMGSAGVAYRSVRHDDKGQCVGLFKPKGGSGCAHAAYLLYAWDGHRISDVYEKIE
jgi:RES domain